MVEKNAHFVGVSIKIKKKQGGKSKQFFKLHIRLKQKFDKCREILNILYLR